MKKHFLFAGLTAILQFLFLTFPVCAQIGLRVEASQLHFLQYEPVYVRITMRNQSGHPLAFGEHVGLRGQLRFEIASTTGRFVRPLPGTTPEVKGIILQPGTAHALTFDISRYYDLRRPDSYTLKAVISHPQLKNAYQSGVIQFSVVRGSTIWQSVVGVPKYLLEKTPALIPSRQYRVVHYHTGKNFLYALVIEDKERVYLVRKLGRDLGGSLRPQCAVDDLSRLNLLVAASSKVFAYYQYDITGKLEKKEVRIKSNTTPRLVTNQDVGTVVLSGGRPARRDMDYEEIKDLPFVSTIMDGPNNDITSGKSLLDDKDGD
ncbi:MAG: hypothetical protein J5806_04050 [Lentisphaeria bacterium]|nr:hypothetical protein [Lentisphaeria bacterium]